jgi:transcriptional regulator with XRE-family HTH domain
LPSIGPMVSLMNETPKDTTSRRVTRSGGVPRQNGHAIRALREKDGQSQTALARAARIDQSTLSAIENEISSAPATTLNRIARGLCVPVAAITRGWDTEDEGVAEDEPEPAAAAAA